MLLGRQFRRGSEVGLGLLLNLKEKLKHLSQTQILVARRTRSRVDPKLVLPQSAPLRRTWWRSRMLANWVKYVLSLNQSIYPFNTCHHILMSLFCPFDPDSQQIPNQALPNGKESRLTWLETQRMSTSKSYKLSNWNPMRITLSTTRSKITLGMLIKVTRM